MEDLFEKSTRGKYRFNSSCVGGTLTTEDLWDLPLEHKNGPCLDDVAVLLHREIETRGTESFVKQTRRSPRLENKFAIVKHIISVRMEEAKDAAESVLRKAKKDRLLLLYADKEYSEDAGKSKEEILEMINAL